MPELRPTFTRFSRQEARRILRTSEALISLQAKGCFSFNGAAQDLFGSPFPKALYVLLDESGHIIAFEAAPVGDAESYVVSFQKHAVSATISVHSLVKTKNLTFGESRRYPAHKYGDGVIGIDLRDEYEVTTRPPRAPKSVPSERRGQRPLLAQSDTAAGG